VLISASRRCRLRFQRVLNKESASMAAKITVKPAVAFVMVHCPFGKMENRP
jgi:hypothetical protein